MALTTKPVKQSPCCARLAARLIMDQANLRNLAQRAAIRHEKGLSTVYLVARMDDARACIEADRKAIVDHDADHAGGA